jgi:restriction system protein
MISYYRLMLGKGSMYAQECFDGNFIGADFGIPQDLAGSLPEKWHDFNNKFIPIFLELHPDKEKIAAGLACGGLWTVSKGMKNGDIVLCPDDKRRYHVGEVTGDYQYQADGVLPHCRSVKWLNVLIDRDEMGEALRRVVGPGGTVINITGYGDEIENSIKGVFAPVIISTDETVEDPSAFAMEKHLEDFLIKNWTQTELAKEYDIFEEDGELVGQQFPTDTGPIDILAISRDKKTLLVIELKKGRASDSVVGQILRYMGYVQDVLAEEDQTVKGIIIALEDDPKLRWALAAVSNVEFYRYQVNFNLMKS